jgi:hypothetical protein
MNLLKPSKYYQYVLSRNNSSIEANMDNVTTVPSEIQSLVDNGFYIDIAATWHSEGSDANSMPECGRFLAGFRLRNPLGNVIGVDLCEYKILIYIPENIRSMISNIIGTEPEYEIEPNQSIERMLYDRTLENSIT